MAPGLTLDQLKTMGATPPATPSTTQLGGGLTLAQVQAKQNAPTPSPLNGFQTITPAQKINQDYKNKKIGAGDVVLQDVGEAARQTNSALFSPFSPLGWIPAIIGGATKLIAAPLDAAEHYIAPKIGETLRALVGPETADKAKQFTKAYLTPNSVDQNFIRTYSSPQVAGDLGALGNVASLAANVAATDAAAKGLASPEIQGKPPTKEAIVGKITQATPEEIPAASRGLTSIAPKVKDAKTFSDLTSILDEEIKSNSSKVDENLGQNQLKFKPADTTRTIDTQGGGAITSDPVGNALHQLETFYEKTNDIEHLARIKDLTTKFENEGLDSNELNAIAREHGRELNAFNQNGELASGLNKQAAENTRSALKNVIDHLNPKAGRDAIDANTSDLIRTRDLVDEMATKVQQIENKLRTYGRVQKFGRYAGKALDVFTQGFAKGFLRQILGLGSEQGTQMNALQLQGELPKYLNLLNRVSELHPADILDLFNQPQ